MKRFLAISVAALVAFVTVFGFDSEASAARFCRRARKSKCGAAAPKACAPAADSCSGGCGDAAAEGCSGGCGEAVSEGCAGGCGGASGGCAGGGCGGEGVISEGVPTEAAPVAPPAPAAPTPAKT